MPKTSDDIVFYNSTDEFVSVIEDVYFLNFLLIIMF